jgi:hypothetical protein
MDEPHSPSDACSFKAGGLIGDCASDGCVPEIEVISLRKV